MRRRRPARTLAATALAVAVLLPLTLGAAPAATPAITTAATAATADDDSADDTRELSPELQARLDEAVQRVMREAGIPGVQVGLWLPGQGRYLRAFGVADTETGEPMTSRHHVRMGSETKTFTATAVLQLVDEGLVGLDDPIARYLDGVPGGEKIRVRDLLDMRSGLYDYTSDQDFVDAFLDDPQRVFKPAELLAYGYRHENAFAPGERFQYSNTNYTLLGQLIERVSGRSLEDVVRDRVTGPSGLRNTLFPNGTGLPAPYAHGYSGKTSNGQVVDSTHWSPSSAWAGGELITDLHDLGRWAGDVATGTLLSPGTQAQRLDFLPTGIQGAGYGLGLFDINGWVGHTGSLFGYESLAIHLPQERATLAVLLNTDVVTGNAEPSTLLGQAITSIITPKHVYFIPLAP
ncbi:serine hydrolase domain-containing protein [Kitasatospora putterlickiae]|uniref:Serine hydrolase domain-containing protein n=1 Tax=Kitasatospora putterlickiae TaxID=221725 RepID=A0ABP4IY36_9ACTN